MSKDEVKDEGDQEAPAIRTARLVVEVYRILNEPLMDLSNVDKAGVLGLAWQIVQSHQKTTRK